MDANTNDRRKKNNGGIPFRFFNYVFYFPLLSLTLFIIFLFQLQFDVCAQAMISRIQTNGNTNAYLLSTSNRLVSSRNARFQSQLAHII